MTDIKTKHWTKGEIRVAVATLASFKKASMENKISISNNMTALF